MFLVLKGHVRQSDWVESTVFLVRLVAGNERAASFGGAARGVAAPGHPILARYRQKDRDFDRRVPSCLESRLGWFVEL